MPGPLKTLFGALQASSFMAGVTIVFGEEELAQQKFGLPCVVMVPTHGQYESPGYITGLDPDVVMSWQKGMTVDFWLYAASIDPAAQGAIDHANAIEALELLMLSAIQDQQAQYTDVNNITYGFTYKASTGRWMVNTNAVSKYGRAWITSVVLSIPIAAQPPIKTPVTKITLNPTVP